MCVQLEYEVHSSVHDWLSMVMLKDHREDMLSKVDLHGSLRPISIFIPISFTYIHARPPPYPFVCIVSPFP